MSCYQFITFFFNEMYRCFFFVGEFLSLSLCLCFIFTFFFYLLFFVKTFSLRLAFLLFWSFGWWVNRLMIASIAHSSLLLLLLKLICFVVVVDVVLPHTNLSSSIFSKWIQFSKRNISMECVSGIYWWSPKDWEIKVATSEIV